MTSARLLAGGLIAIVGGILMIWSGYDSHSLLYQTIDQYGVPYLQLPVAVSAATLLISILEYLNALGGIVVVMGGLVLISGHRRTGSIVIILGGGAGLIGLLASFGYSAYKLGLENTLSFAPYWAGLVLTVVARRVSRGSKNQVKAT